MKTTIPATGRCAKCNQAKPLTFGYCAICIEIVQVAEEKKQALKDWAVDLNQGGKK